MLYGLIIIGINTTTNDQNGPIEAWWKAEFNLQQSDSMIRGFKLFSIWIWYCCQELQSCGQWWEKSMVSICLWTEINKKCYSTIYFTLKVASSESTLSASNKLMARSIRKASEKSSPILAYWDFFIMIKNHTLFLILFSSVFQNFKVSEPRGSSQLFSSSVTQKPLNAIKKK